MMTQKQQRSSWAEDHKSIYSCHMLPKLVCILIPIKWMYYCYRARNILYAKNLQVPSPRRAIENASVRGQVARHLKQRDSLTVCRKHTSHLFHGFHHRSGSSQFVYKACRVAYSVTRANSSTRILCSPQEESCQCCFLRFFWTDRTLHQQNTAYDNKPLQCSCSRLLWGIHSFHTGQCKKPASNQCNYVNHEGDSRESWSTAINALCFDHVA